MPDALTAAAESLAPSRASTRFFDPAAAQNVISRYGNAGVGMADSEALAGATSRLMGARMDRSRLKQDEITLDREETEWNEKQAAKASRGEFLTKFAEIDPEAEDFDTVFSEVAKSLPPGVADDDAVRDMVAYKRSLATNARERREAEAVKRQAFDNQMAMFRERQKASVGLKGISDEDIKSATGPDGEVDWPTIYFKAGERERDLKAGEFDRKEDVKQGNRERTIKLLKDDRDLDAAQKAAKAKAMNHLVDPEAFPRQVDVLRQKYGKDGKPADLDVLKTKYGQEVTDAMNFDKDREEAEIEAARGAKTADDYANLVPNASPAKKAKRREFWNVANDSGITNAAPAPAAKPLDLDTAKKFLEQAGGDKAKARQLAKEAGHDF